VNAVSRAESADAGEPGWKPIELPTAAELAYVSPKTAQLGSLRSAWLQSRRELDAVRPDAVREFMARLVRSWAIETGILERLYDLDEGATKTLIEHGFRADLVNRSESSMAPEDLVTVLNDHVLAAGMVEDLISEARPFSTQFIRELHALLTRHQETTRAITTAGDAVEVPLLHGEWKRLPNNPQRPDGNSHEYAPPEHVAAEIDRFVEGVHLVLGEPASVAAAWLHHRFTQIHPFQDGNGRVARALTNFVFIRDGLFPLVVHRTHRVRYIEALEAADGGDLGPLIDLFAEIEADTILKALSFSSEERAASVVDDVVDRLTNKVGARVRDRESALRTVSSVARELRERGRDHLLSLANGVATRISSAGMPVRAYWGHGGPDVGNDQFWRFQVIGIAHELQHWVNFEEDHHWFRVALEGTPVRLQVVVSLHHVGRELSGVVRAVAFAELREDRPADAGEDGQDGTVERITKNTTPAVFSFTWQDEADEVMPRFATWLDEAFAVALRYWEDTI
jgi:hypothetical protein